MSRQDEPLDLDTPRRCWLSSEVAAIAAAEGIQPAGVFASMVTSSPTTRADVVEMLRTAAAVPVDDGRPRRTDHRS